MQSAIAACLCFIFGVVIFRKGLLTIKSKEPVAFWYKSKVLAEKITDTKDYNKSNGKMWIAYSKLYFLSGLLSMFNAKIGLVSFLFSATAGTLFLIIYAQYLLFMYKVKKNEINYRQQGK